MTLLNVLFEVSLGEELLLAVSNALPKFAVDMELVLKPLMSLPKQTLRACTIWECTRVRMKVSEDMLPGDGQTRFMKLIWSTYFQDLFVLTDMIVKQNGHWKGLPP